jgi:hypothetical protein
MATSPLSQPNQRDLHAGNLYCSDPNCRFGSRRPHKGTHAQEKYRAKMRQTNVSDNLADSEGPFSQGTAATIHLTRMKE